MHLLHGYSSADNYEKIIISRRNESVLSMETNEQQRKVRFSDIKSDEISKISFNTGQRKPSTTFSPALS